MLPDEFDVQLPLDHPVSTSDSTTETSDSIPQPPENTDHVHTFPRSSTSPTSSDSGSPIPIPQKVPVVPSRGSSTRVPASEQLKPPCDQVPPPFQHQGELVIPQVLPQSLVRYDPFHAPSASDPTKFEVFIAKTPTFSEAQNASVGGCTLDKIDTVQVLAPVPNRVVTTKLSCDTPVAESRVMNIAEEVHNRDKQLASFPPCPFVGPPYRSSKFSNGELTKRFTTDPSVVTAQVATAAPGLGDVSLVEVTVDSTVEVSTSPAPGPHTSTPKSPASSAPGPPQVSPVQTSDPPQLLVQVPLSALSTPPPPAAPGTGFKTIIRLACSLPYSGFRRVRELFPASHLDRLVLFGQHDTFSFAPPFSLPRPFEQWLLGHYVCRKKLFTFARILSSGSNPRKSGEFCIRVNFLPFIAKLIPENDLYTEMGVSMSDSALQPTTLAAALFGRETVTSFNLEVAPTVTCPVGAPPRLCSSFLSCFRFALAAL